MGRTLAVSLVMALALGSGCTCARGGTPAEAKRDFGQYADRGAWDADGEVRAARAILDEADRGAPPRDEPGRRAFVVAWQAGGKSEAASATAGTLADAVAAAAQAAAARSKAVAARVEVDVVTAVEGATIDDESDVPLASIGQWGVLVTRDDGKTGFVLPGEVAQGSMFASGKLHRLDWAKIDKRLRERADVADGELKAMRAYRFRTDARVENAKRDGVLPVFRGMVERPAQASVDNLLAAVRRGADYLVRITSDQGRYVYMHHPLDDRDDSSYGWLRHAGTTYALLEAYEEFGDARYLERAERAIAYMKEHLRKDGDAAYLLDTTDEEQQKVGGAGLALLALTKHAAVTGKRADLETMRSLARLIAKQQYEDGRFRANADVESETGKKPSKKEPVYYAGEAIVSLMRLYAIDPQPSYLDVARKGADWVAHVRDAYVSEDNQEHDHWISYAYNDLYRVTRDEAYVEHAYKIARAIQKKQHPAEGAAAPDYASSFYEGQSTPASTRVEAYDADIALSRFAGKPDDWLLAPATQVARFMLGQQYGADDSYWLKNPARADGGVRESLLVHDVRIDYVQHAMSAWLHLARILRDPAYGKSGVPNQDPVK